MAVGCFEFQMLAGNDVPTTANVITNDRQKDMNVQVTTLGSFFDIATRIEYQFPQDPDDGAWIITPEGAQLGTKVPFLSVVQNLSLPPGGTLTVERHPGPNILYFTVCVTKAAKRR